MNRACGVVAPTGFGTFLPSAGRRTPLAPGLIFRPKIGSKQDFGRNEASAGTGKEEQLTVPADQPVRESDALESSDLELVRSAGRGDSAAFHTLVDRYAPELFRLAQSLSNTRADAEDIVQETLFGAYRALNQFDGRASVKTWLKRILVRQAAKAWHKSRGSRRSVPIENLELQEQSSPAARNGTSSAVAHTDRRIDVAAVLRTLPAEFRQVLVLREFEQMSYAEIAETLGVPQGTVESRLHRARAELRSRLGGYNHERG